MRKRQNTIETSQYKKFKELNLFLESIDIKVETKKRYKVGLNRFADLLIDRNIHTIQQVTVEDIIAFKEILVNDITISDGSKYVYFSVVKSFFTWCYNIGIKNIAKSISLKYDDKYYKKEGIELEDFYKIANNIKTDTLKGKRNFALFLFLYLSGARQISARKLRWKDIRLEDVDGYAVVVANIVLKGRGLKTHEIPFNNKLKNAVMEYRNAIINKYGDLFNEDWFVFSTNGNPICEKTIRIAMTNAIKNADVYKKGKVTVHSLRHGIAQHLLRKTGDINLVKEQLGHRDIGTTNIYLGMEQKKTQLRKAVSALGGI